MAWMIFVDGENFTIQAQKVATDRGVRLVEGQFWHKDCFIWLPGRDGATFIVSPVRAYYYATVQGSQEDVSKVRESLWQLKFDPHVFAKRKGEKAKGVDITLTKDMLVHAFSRTMDGALIVAGDGDYAPLLEEVKRHGVKVVVAFFQAEGLNPELKLACDQLHDITDAFVDSWQRYRS